MRLCLINGPRFDCRPSAKSTVPLPLAYLAAYARQFGHQVTCIDGIPLGSPQKIVSRVAAAEAEVVGIAVNTNDRFAAFATIAAIRQALPKAFIIGGGHHLTHSAEDAMALVKDLDAIVVGQGEETLKELLDRLPDTDSLGQVRGLVWRDRDGQAVRNEPRPLMKDIDSLPMPAWDLFDLNAYGMRTIDEDESHMLGVMTMRGCPHRCVFCGSSITRQVQFMSPQLAVDQLEYLHRRHGLKAFRLYDDTPMARKSHFIAFCEELLRRKLDLTWWSNSRAQRPDPDILALMIRCGCKIISLGVETGSEKVLQACRKDVTCEEMIEAFHRVAEAGFARITACLLVGLPGETGETIDESVRFVKKLRDVAGKAWHECSLIGQLPLMYPGTEMEALSKRQGTLPENFSWNSPFVDPNWYLPLVNRRYRAVPHFVNPDFPISAICRHVMKHHWKELAPGRKRRFRRAPLRRIQRALGLGPRHASRMPVSAATPA